MQEYRLQSFFSPSTDYEKTCCRTRFYLGMCGAICKFLQQVFPNSDFLKLAIAEAVIYVAAPKSIAAYTAFGVAMRTAKAENNIVKGLFESLFGAQTRQKKRKTPKDNQK